MEPIRDSSVRAEKKLWVHAPLPRPIEIFCTRIGCLDYRGSDKLEFETILAKFIRIFKTQSNIAITSIRKVTRTGNLSAPDLDKGHLPKLGVIMKKTLRREIHIPERYQVMDLGELFR
jgi:hypothetical protein